MALKALHVHYDCSSLVNTIFRGHVSTASLHTKYVLSELKSAHSWDVQALKNSAEAEREKFVELLGRLQPPEYTPDVIQSLDAASLRTGLDTLSKATQSLEDLTACFDVSTHSTHRLQQLLEDERSRNVMEIQNPDAGNIVPLIDVAASKPGASSNAWNLYQRSCKKRSLSTSSSLSPILEGLFLSKATYMAR